MGWVHKLAPVHLCWYVLQTQCIRRNNMLWTFWYWILPLHAELSVESWGEASTKDTLICACHIATAFYMTSNITAVPDPELMITLLVHCPTWLEYVDMITWQPKWGHLRSWNMPSGEQAYFILKPNSQYQNRTNGRCCTAKQHVATLPNYSQLFWLRTVTCSSLYLDSHAGSRVCHTKYSISAERFGT